MVEGMIKSMTKNEVMEIAITSGKILLCNGAETYRVEDTMLRICAMRGMRDVSAFCTPSAIIISDESLKGNCYMARVTDRGVNLSLVSEINDISFGLKTWPYNFTETMAILQEKLTRRARPIYIDIISAGFGGGGFAVMLGGGVKEFIAAFAGSAISMWIIKLLSPFKPSSFWSTTLAGAFISVVTILARKLFPNVNMELTIAGAIMPYLPGMAFTNGLRDYIAGDLISGNSRAGEAVFLVSGIVIGIAAVLGTIYK
ncbi:MAG: threonine/serine exporter family protein [Acidaminococcaceae bacterium]|nr:threonine/serine exporter family protein [Acidaminococcaceae bacterium]